MNPLLRFCDISFGYGGLDVIRSASFDLQAGSCTALIGPYGAGKTTFLRLAAGTLHCRSGSVILNDVPLQRLALRKVARTVALVPQQLDVPFQFTVREVVEQGRHADLLQKGGLYARLYQRQFEAVDELATIA